MTRRFFSHTRLLALAVLAMSAFPQASAQEQDLLNGVDPGAGFTSVSRAYSSMDAEYERTGTELEIDQVRTIEIGQLRDDLQLVYGSPAHNNLDGSAEFHLSLPLTEKDRLICQYRVFFDGEKKVERAVWRRPQCADLVVQQLN